MLQFMGLPRAGHDLPIEPQRQLHQWWGWWVQREKTDHGATVSKLGWGHGTLILASLLLQRIGTPHIMMVKKCISETVLNCWSPNKLVWPWNALGPHLLCASQSLSRWKALWKDTDLGPAPSSPAPWLCNLG